MSTEEIAQVTAAVEKVTLRSSDNEEFVVDLKVAMLSTTLKNLFDEGCAAGTAVPLANVTGKILSKVIEYCKKHSEAAGEENLEDWDDEFVDDVDDATLFDLIVAASYLEIKGLLDVTCQCVADIIKGNTPEEMQAALNTKTKLTPKEEEKARRENKWAFR